MRFLSIVRGAETRGHPPEALIAAMTRLTQDSLKDGSLLQTGGLASSAAGARVRFAGRKITVSDGPFSEAKEVVGGYAVLEAPSREEAVAAAVRFMQLHKDHWPEWEGECEIREIVFLAP